MVSTAAVEHSLRDVQFLAGPATILGSLVPGASVAAMVNRAPEVLLRFDLAVACQRLVELRQLCSCDDESLPCAVDSDETATTLCSVSRTLELHPSLLLSRVPIQNMATAAAAHLLSLAPHKVDPSSAFQAVRANPEWLTSLAQYDHYDMLPVAVQNAVTPPWNEWSDIRERVEAYDRAWDIASVGEPQRAQWDE